MSTVTQTKPNRRIPLIAGSFTFLVLASIGVIVLDAWSSFGASPSGARLERMQQSPQFEDGRFTNRMPMAEPSNFWSIAARFFFERQEYKVPSEPLPVVSRSGQDFTSHPDDLRLTWFGHSTFLVELDGVRLLFDPHWGERASPSSFIGPKRFYDPPMPLDELPEIDAVVISHDHYDHLNEETIRKLSDRIPLFITPLGVGAHLEGWGVAPDKIREFDWWETAEVGDVGLVATPARHFSGRSLASRDKTLWAGWAIMGTDRRIFFSGDSGYSHRFKEIGERLGPFDLTLMEAGAYNQDWPDVHFGPEQAVQAHLDVRGEVMMPVHWGMFDLAFHTWTEPIERVLAEAERVGVAVVTPRPGMSVELPPAGVDRWWPQTPWRTADEYPVRSTGLSSDSG